MSATSVAFEHYYEGAQMDSEKIRVRWASRLPSLARADFSVPKHIELKGALPLLGSCKECDESQMLTSAHVLGTFVDRHHYCAEGRAPVWTCPDCGALEFEHRWHCRMCECARPETARLRFVSPIEVIHQTADFLVRRDGGAVSATIRVGSLREALRAARAIYPHEPALVDLPDAERSWGLGHKSK